MPVSCRNDELSEAYAELDRNIEMRASYDSAFIREVEEMKRMMEAESDDSMKFEIAANIYRRYRYHNVDSVIRYVDIQKAISDRTGIREHVYLTQIRRITQMFIQDRYDLARPVYESLDTTDMTYNMRKNCYGAGVTLYRQFPDAADKFRYYAENYVKHGFDPTFNVRMQYELLLNDRRPAEALEVLLEYYNENELSLHGYAGIALGIALAYSAEGNSEQKRLWLARSASFDIKASVREYVSLLMLSRRLMEDGDYSRAARYMEVATRDALDGNFTSNIEDNSQILLMTGQALNRVERSRYHMLVFTLSLSLVFLLTMIAFSAFLMSQRRKLKETNASLKDVNRIKNNYLLRYMLLASGYIKRIEETPRAYRKLYKSEGVEALAAKLKEPSYAEEEYRQFYRTFDEIFLGLFPDFPSQVNRLLKPDARFHYKVGEPLPTGLRILAVIRLGIVESPKIAEFLDCALTTVYTYRNKIKAAALCSREEFEERVKKIGFR